MQFRIETALGQTATILGVGNDAAAAQTKSKVYMSVSSIIMIAYETESNTRLVCRLS
jgi:hypothetical protein